MVNGAIIEKGEGCYSRLGKLFRSIGNAQTEYNWLITDSECRPHSWDIEGFFLRNFVVQRREADGYCRKRGLPMGLGRIIGL